MPVFLYGVFEIMLGERSQQLESGGSFFCEEPSQVFSVEDFSSDESMMVATAEQFSRKEVLPLVERIEKQEDGLMPDLIRKAGQLGLLGIDAAEEYGGLGLGKNLAARIIEMLSLNASFSVTAGVTSGIGQLGLSLYGTEPQKHKYLPKVLSGEWVAAYCLSEPNSGTDALAASSQAKRQGGHWLLNGSKMWVSNAKWANLFLVVARIEGEGLAAFLVERDYAGVRIEREEHKMGLKGSSTARVTLENVEVPLSNLLHEPGKGHYVALNALNLGRFKLSSMSLGPARDAFENSLRYSQERRQFGQPICNFGLIRKKIAESAIRYFLAESMIYRTGHLIDLAFEKWGGTVEGNQRAAAEFALECSACKVFASEAQGFIVDEALQVFGGYGFTEEFPVARHYRDARISRIYEGTNEINRVSIASRLLKSASSCKGRSPQSFAHDLALKLLASPQEDQIYLGALADLAILHFAEQSARLRARRVGGYGQMLYSSALGWLQANAVEAFRCARPDSLECPKVDLPQHDEIAQAALERGTLLSAVP